MASRSAAPLLAAALLLPSRRSSSPRPRSPRTVTSHCATLPLPPLLLSLSLRPCGRAALLSCRRALLLSRRRSSFLLPPLLPLSAAARHRRLLAAPLPSSRLRTVLALQAAWQGIETTRCVEMQSVAPFGIRSVHSAGLPVSVWGGLSVIADEWPAMAG